MMTSANLADLAELLAPLLTKRVAIITGAGVSAESGISTFRGADGYWRNLDPRQLATPQAFERDPALVWEWYGDRREKGDAAAPNPAHRAIAALSGRPSDLLVVTQNVDDLHERAGTKPSELVHVHGEIAVGRCVACDWSTRAPVAYKPPPRCERCQALLRPGVVWFGEALDRTQVARVENFFRKPCDLVLVVGTTAVFGYIVDWAMEGGLVVEVNPAETELSARAHHCVRAPAGQVLPSLLGVAV